MDKGDTAFEVLSSDLHPVVRVFCLVRIFEYQRGTGPLRYHIHVGVIRKLSNTKVMREVTNIDDPWTVVFV